MKTCPKCSEICSNKSNFCSNCGYAFGDAGKEPQDSEQPVAAAPGIAELAPDTPDTAGRELRTGPLEEAVLTLPPEAEIASEPEVYIELVRIADDEALIMPSEIYIDNDYVGTLEYDSRKKYPVQYGKHIVVIETGEQRRTRQFDNSKSAPVQVYRYTVRPHNAPQKSSHPRKKKHIFAKVICTLFVLAAGCAMFLPKDIIGKVVPSRVKEQVSNWVQILSSVENANNEPGAPAESTTPESADPAVQESADPAVPSENPSVESAAQDSPNAEGYSQIYEEYAGKLRDATPGLIEEFNREAASNTGGITGLAEINNAKISKLSDISNEGIEKMADYMWIHGSGDYSEYSQWADKLNAVYTEEAQKITDSYMAAGVESLG